MKIRSLIVATLAGFTAMAAYSQSTPLHPVDIRSIGSTDLIKVLNNWQPGQQLDGVSTIDDQFYIGRTRLLPRIEDKYDASKDGKSERKMLLWSPMDDPTSQWKALPRYNFNNDNFSMWSYLTTHGNWSAGWWRATGGLLDVAHKNGVKVGCVLGTPWASTVTLDPSPDGPNYNQLFAWMCTKDESGIYTNLPTLAKYLKYYGIDNMGVNSEFYATRAVMEDIQEMFYQLHLECQAIGWEFEMTWYDGTSDGGGITFDRGLGSHNAKMFGNSEHIVTDQLFFNYNWTNAILLSSATYARNLGRNSFDVFAGFDIEGRGLSNRYWNALNRHDISIGLWGTHMQSQLYKSSVDYGSGDMAMQTAYQRKLELLFSGGYRNPAVLPALASDCGLDNKTMENFHGLATFLTAKSTLASLPFVTRFNLGNGLKFYQDGKVAFNSTWYNINTQDWMPTWRWWITNAADEAVKLTDEDVIVPEFTFDDAWFGGTSLRLYGKTTCSRLKLFKTAFEVNGENEISAVYKVKNGTDSHAKLFVALSDNVNAYKEISLPDAKTAGEWTSFKASLSDLGITGGEIALIGVVVENTAADYDLLLGEIAISNPIALYNPVTPSIKEVEVLRGRNSSFDFKMRYEARDESDGVKTYNDEVDTWYYEIYSQQEGGEPQLLTATTSWASYVVGAPITGGFENRRARFGVRPVSPDGARSAEIGWSEYYDIPYTDSEVAVVVDRDAIKPGETFTLSMTDDMCEAMDWALTTCVGGETVYTASGVHTVTLSLPNEGIYDLILTQPSTGDKYLMRGKVQVTPEATGKKPVINDLVADRPTADGGDNIRLEYSSQDGEGMVSRALRLEDPHRLMIPGGAQKGNTYTYALWLKPRTFVHKESGTNLINKFDNGAKWPSSDWGQLWFPIENNGCVRACLASCSVNVSDPEYALQPGVWTHVAICQEGKSRLALYINGKEVGSVVPSDNPARTTAQDEVCHIYIGGVSAGKASFDGYIDEFQIWDKALSAEEVQKAMKGFDENAIPEGLQAYYKFESVNDDNSISNLGYLGSDYNAVIEYQRGDATPIAPDCNNPGWPGIVGSYAVTSTPDWQLPGASFVSTGGKVADVCYYAKGDYEAGVVLSNVWGSDERYTTLKIMTTGVEETVGSDFFIDLIGKDAYIHFGEDGNYAIELYDMAGRLLQSEGLRAENGGVAVVKLTGDGVGVLRVVREGKPYASMKIAR